MGLSNLGFVFLVNPTPPNDVISLLTTALLSDDELFEDALNDEPSDPVYSNDIVSDFWIAEDDAGSS